MMKYSPLFFICLLILFVSGCAPTYTNENLEQSILDICKKEYKLDVSVRRVGRTVGIYLPINGLFESKVKSSGRNMTLEDALSSVKFSKEAADKIDDVSMALSRVALSSGADVDFYVLIAADTKASGLQIVITRYVNDMKRLILGDVSRGDYVQRLLMDMDFGPTAAAEETVKEFFYDAARLKPQTVIARYFSKTAAANAQSSDFLRYISAQDGKNNRAFFVEDIKGLQVSKSRVLVKVSVRETPSGETKKYLFALDTLYIPYMIENVFSEYPDEFKAYEDDAVWQKDGFFLEDITLPDFLARQMATRIKEFYKATGFVKAEYRPKEKKFKVIFDSIKKSPKDKPTDFDGAWKIISAMMRRYEFKDFESVELFSITDAKRQTMTRRELIDKFWPTWLIKR